MPAAPSIRVHAPAYALLAVLFLISAAQWVRDTRDRVQEILYGDQYVGSPFDLSPFNLSVTGLDPSAQEAGLREGDVLLAVNGRPVKGYADYQGPLRHVRFGESFRVRVRSGSVEKEVSIKPPRFTYLGFSKTDSAAYPFIVLLRIATPLFCLVLGFWVAAVRIGDSAAWQLLLLMLSVANTIQDSRTIFGNEDAFQPFFTAMSLGFSTLTPMALLLFGIVFPERLALDRKLPWLKWLILAPLLTRALLAAVTGALAMRHHALAMALWPYNEPIARIGAYLSPAAVVLFFAALGYKTLTASNRDSRRRLLLLDAGAAISILPFVALVLLNVLKGVQFKGIVAVAPIGMLVILPLTMAYVIVVHRAMDMRVAIRQGLQYLLATSGIRVLQVAISIAIIVAAATISGGDSVTRRMLLISVGFLLLAGIRGFAQRLRVAIDRRFFRAAFNSEQVLSDLSHEVRTVVKRDQLMELVCRRISESLHVPRVAMLMRGSSSYDLAFTLGYGGDTRASFATGGPVHARLEREREPQTLYLEDPQSWVNSELDGHPDRAGLKQLESQVLLPLESGDSLAGFISLAQKRSEEPYTAADLRLLRSVAAQTGLALENSRLTEEVASEMAQRERLNRELEIAREVQQRLFPQKTPQVEGVELAGSCRPALSVGGDYYDFLKLKNGQLVFAVGDVSGKGVPAALLMAVVQASIRAQSMAQSDDLALLTANVNLLVTESSAKTHFATLFYALYDPQTRLLRYVNAGHNPPLVVRAHGEIEWLRSTGVAVGWSKRATFKEAQITLAPGDTVFAYTDGLTEAMNAVNEEFGEERFAQAAIQLCGTSPESAMQAMLNTVDQFTAGAAQHDDMTMVLLRIAE